MDLKKKRTQKNSINNSEIVSFPVFLLGTVQYSDVKWFGKPFQNDLHNPLTSHSYIKNPTYFLQICDN